MRCNVYRLSLMGLLAVVTLLPALLMGLEASEKAKSDEPLACHSDTKSALAAPDDDNVKNINAELQDLYKQINKTADYEEPCNHSIFSKGGKSIEIFHVLEKFEMRRNNYRRGLWGYCANEGAAALIASIKLFKEQVTGQNIVICDRSKLLMCHSKFGRCQCAQDYRNLRNIASDYYNVTERENTGPPTNITTNQCILLSGSDCPIFKDWENETTVKFKCVPGTHCNYKQNTSQLCYVPIIRGEKESKSRMFQARYRREANEVDNNNSTPEPTEEADNATGRAGGDTEDYSILSDDYPSIYCQCVGYLKELGESDATMIAGRGWLLLVSLAWTVLAF